jgi:hypothetical protein
MADSETLTPKQLQALAELLKSGNVSKAAKAGGVDRRTVHRWLAEDPGFKRAVGEAEAAALTLAASGLVRLMDKAIRVFEVVLDSSTATTAQKLRAADSVLEKVIKLRELVTLEQRVKNLEDQLSGKFKQ